MRWFERKIRRYEHRRWTTDDNRRVQPFEWGLEHIGGSAAESNPQEYVRQYARHAIETSHEWFATTPPPDYRVDGENVLTFPSSIESAWPENNIVHAQIFPGKKMARRCWCFPTGMPSGMGSGGFASGFSGWGLRR